MDKQELGGYVQRLQDGDNSAFNLIYDETKDSVYALLCSYTKNTDESLDLMQETYITVNNKINTLKDINAVRSWINRIAINKANRYFEKSKKEILLSEEGQGLFEIQVEIDEEFLPQELLDSKEKQRIIKDIIDNLPLEQKTAVYLYYFDELSLAEVAEDMQCSEGTVKSRLNYARKKIKGEVDTWEKKGTKLYSTGIPVLLLLLRNQLGDVNVPIEKSKKVLEEVMKQINANNIPGNNFNNDVTNNLNSVVEKSAKTVGKAAGLKAGAVGLAIIAALGSGAFIYNKVSSDNMKQKEITLTIEELKDKGEVYKNTDDFNNNVESMYSYSMKLYEISKENRYDTMKLDEIIDGINKMSAFDVYNMAWADSIINQSTDDMKSIIRYNEQIAKNKKEKTLTDEDKEMIDLSNQMTIYFINNQENMLKLKEVLEKVSSWNIDESDKTFKELKESIKEDASNALDDYKEYEAKLTELKNSIRD